MITLRQLMLLCAFALPLGGCLKTGSSASPPTNLTAIPGENSVTLTWTAEPGVEYWLYYAKGTTISRDTRESLGGISVMAVTSPYVLGSLLNDTTYAFSLDGRRDGGPGGSSSPAVAAAPRLAGATWTVNSAFGGAAMSGVNNDTAGVLYASGAGGALYQGTISLAASGVKTTAWSALSHPLTGTALAGNSYGIARHVAVGRGGAIMQSADGTTWTNQASGTTSDLNAVMDNGIIAVAVGANGTLLTSNDGKTWTARNSGTSNHLYGVAYVGAKYFALGANGTLLTSNDVITWTAVTTGTTQTLKSIAHGNSTWVAVGAAGTVLTSTDAAQWTLRPAASTHDLNSIAYGSQFVAVGNQGMVLTGTDGITWTTRAPGSTADLNAVRYVLQGYHAFGSGGVYLTAY